MSILYWPITIMGSYAFYYAYRADWYNRIGILSLVFWFYTVTVTGYLPYFGGSEDTQFTIFNWATSILLFWLFLGMIFSYIYGPLQQKIKLKNAAISVLTLIVIMFIVFYLGTKFSK